MINASFFVNRKSNTRLLAQGAGETSCFALWTPVCSVAKAFLTTRSTEVHKRNPHRGNQGICSFEWRVTGAKPYNDDTPCLHIQTT